jgi:hypothetical protein
MLHSSLLSIFVIAGAAGLAISLIAQEMPLTQQGYEREELGATFILRPTWRLVKASEPPHGIRQRRHSMCTDIRPCLRQRAG